MAKRKAQDALWYIKRIAAARKLVNNLDADLDQILDFTTVAELLPLLGELQSDIATVARTMQQKLIDEHGVGHHHTGQVWTDLDNGDEYDVIGKIAQSDPPPPKQVTDWDKLGSRIAAIAADKANEGERPVDALARIFPTVVPMSGSVKPKQGGMKKLGLDLDNFVDTEEASTEKGPPRLEFIRVKRAI